MCKSSFYHDVVIWNLATDACNELQVTSAVLIQNEGKKKVANAWSFKFRSIWLPPNLGVAFG